MSIIIVLRYPTHMLKNWRGKQNCCISYTSSTSSGSCVFCTSGVWGKFVSTSAQPTMWAVLSYISTAKQEVVDLSKFLFMIDQGERKIENVSYVANILKYLNMHSRNSLVYEYTSFSKSSSYSPSPSSSGWNEKHSEDVVYRLQWSWYLKMCPY